jgi:hypothetical protein
MKLLTITLLLAGLGLAQTSLVIRVTDAGVESIAKVSGPAAVAGLDVLKQWMATQTICTPVPKVPAVDGDADVTTAAIPASRDCKPKYSNPAELIKTLTLDTAEQLAPQYPPALLRADVDEAKAKQAIVEAKRKAAFAAARAEKP